MAVVPLAPVISRWHKIHNSLYPPTDCTALVVWGQPYTLSSTLGISKITKFIRDTTYIPLHNVGVMVGCMLGDAHFRVSTTGNVRFMLKQSTVNFPVVWTAFMYLSHYCASAPARAQSILGGKHFTAVVLGTRNYPVFTQLYNLFYLNGVKVISPELYHYLSPTALAWWIMCDGARSMGGLVLCTECFTYPEVVCLMNILMLRYDLQCTIHTTRSGPRIYVSENSMPKLRSIVGSHMLPFSMYKLAGVARRYAN